jgi:tRNA-specific 2-thiouridylase
MGEHDGLMFHTMGQRKGLHIGGIKEKGQAGGGDHDAWFVVGKDMDKNVLYVVQGHDHPALLKGDLVAEQLSWVSNRAPHTHWYTPPSRVTGRLTSHAKSRPWMQNRAGSILPRRSGR